MRVLKLFGWGILVVFAIIGITSTFSVGKLIIVDGIPKKSLYKTSSLEPTLEAIPELAEGSVAIKIGSKTQIIDNVFVILVENKKGEVQIFSSDELIKFENIHHYFLQDEDNKSTKISNHAIESLMLQVATGSSDAHAGLCCTGPYVNANGEIVPRSCVKKSSACY